jgi:hypothetical protein
MNDNYELIMNDNYECYAHSLKITLDTNFRKLKPSKFIYQIKYNLLAC